MKPYSLTGVGLTCFRSMVDQNIHESYRDEIGCLLSRIGVRITLS